MTKRYKSFFKEDEKETIQSQIKDFQDQITKLRDKSSNTENMSLEDKQKIKNQINSIENKIVKKKLQLDAIKGQ